MNSPGLRERKKARTRRTIQEQALRLFAEHGYDATTIEQIAEAAEISPSTIFRYFPTKEDIVVQDDYDPLLARVLAEQPKDKPPLRALRDAFRESMALIPPEEQREILARARLQLTIPAIRSRVMQNMLDTLDQLSSVIAQRAGRDPADLEVVTLTGAVIGALIPTLQRWVAEDGARPLSELVDEALALLEEGLPV
ncbi:hypothetical protein Aph01nite_37510 [Acrocarpospora phusangensis]|uniref:HTH tetR-type domain-containing protein n=1 Tax=Acrocarpospora phusangensis TaxID=1070424 RepID=A0A919UKV0_9ACTN|nr:TetR family transcriptional regulator [Acrocarpospora phusangensis]GIH25441.1 hypothetical protein Aph01nite_37510 [Acrocarpospora phusangensis]